MGREQAVGTVVEGFGTADARRAKPAELVAVGAFGDAAQHQQQIRAQQDVEESTTAAALAVAAAADTCWVAVRNAPQM